MPTHGSVAKSVRLRKEAHPELYCRALGCLWRLTGTDSWCPRHLFTIQSRWPIKEDEDCMRTVEESLRLAKEAGL